MSGVVHHKTVQTSCQHSQSGEDLRWRAGAAAWTVLILPSSKIQNLSRIFYTPSHLQSLNFLRYDLMVFVSIDLALGLGYLFKD